MPTTNIIVPELGESVVEATVARWLKKPGDPVGVGEPVVELETEKVDLEVGASRAGVLASIERPEGSDVKVGETLGVIEEAAGGQSPVAGLQPPAAGLQSPVAGREPAPSQRPAERVRATASARKLAAAEGVDLAELTGTGEAGRIVRSDVERHLATRRADPRLEERVRMSRRRQTIARRLVEAQRTAAMLTTFNEVDMTEVMAIRRRHKEAFRERHGVGLGISSFFVKAVVSALRAFPSLNAEIQGDEIVLKRYYDIGIAIGASGGLVVPVLRDADRLSVADIERGTESFVRKAKDDDLTLDDLEGGTFTITNGGVFGSLLSTPILNPPQVGILGLHKIEDRAVPVDGQVVIRPMMYLALSYDHRIVDGREAVQCLVHVKALIEEPAAMLFA